MSPWALAGMQRDDERTLQLERRDPHEGFDVLRKPNLL
jgi:hypothetical protein